MSRLTEAEISSHLEDVNNWEYKDNMIQKIFKFPSFPAAIVFVTHVAFLAEAANHHPDITIRYNQVTLALTTHDAGGISVKDFDLAAAVDAIM